MISLAKASQNSLAAVVRLSTIELVRSVSTVDLSIAKLLPTNARAIVTFKLIRLTNDRRTKLDPFVGRVSTVRFAIADFAWSNGSAAQAAEVIG